jgi:hypothetical protein
MIALGTRDEFRNPQIKAEFLGSILKDRFYG